MGSKTVLKLAIPQVSFHQEVYGNIFQNVEKLFLCSIHVVLSCIHHSFALLQTVFLYFNKLPKHRVTACQIMDNAKRLKKHPKHIVLVINEDDISMPDVVNLIVWSVFSGISHVTLCDSKGFLLNNSTTLQKKFETNLGEICDEEKMVYPTTSFHLGMHKASESISNASNSVIVSSIASSRNKFLECVKTMSGELMNNDILKREFNASAIDARLKKIDGCYMEPGLAIIFGPYLSYFGYQPWNVRLTEFISLPTHKKLSYKSYLQVLSIFAGCEQRFGS